MAKAEQKLDDPGFAVLRGLAGGVSQQPDKAAPKVLHIALYCYQSFAVRLFHSLTRAYGFSSHALFFKDVMTNNHLPITAGEIALLQERVKAIAPDLVTISVLAPYALAAHEVVTAVREVCAAPVIAGGKHATVAPDEALLYADYVCKGEGELVLLDIFERMKQGRDFRAIKGLWYRDESGTLVDMGQRPLIQDMDILPFEAVGEPNMTFIEYGAISEKDPECDSEYMLMMAGRGCVYKCSYCVNSLLIPMNKGNGRFVRMRSPTSLLAQIRDRRTRQPKATAINFNDEVFGVFDDWTKEFCDLYGKEKDRLPFNCELVPKLIKEKNISQLVKVGLFEMHFGIQSGSDDIRNNILDRPGKNEELVEKGHLLARLGIQPQCDIILGNPFDTEEVMEDTIRLLRRMPRPLKLNTYKLQYFPHYPLTQRALEAGFITEADMTPEVVAERCLYNMLHRPNWRSLDRRTTLENCVYLIPWDNRLVWWLADRLLKGPSLPLALITNVLAIWRYRLDFRQDPILIFLRRIYLVGRMTLTGNWGPLIRRLGFARG